MPASQSIIPLWAGPPGWSSLQQPTVFIGRIRPHCIAITTLEIKPTSQGQSGFTAWAVYSHFASRSWWSLTCWYYFISLSPLDIWATRQANMTHTPGVQILIRWVIITNQIKYYYNGNLTQQKIFKNSVFSVVKPVLFSKLLVSYKK